MTLSLDDGQRLLIGLPASALVSHCLFSTEQHNASLKPMSDSVISLFKMVQSLLISLREKAKILSVMYSMLSGLVYSISSLAPPFPYFVPVALAFL